ncbi:NPP1 family protein [Echinimonas agarilytica]|uniref:NPP1 family protein n=1 Tax=Echinimonas agarilytica TaxID=1215918 RepID=A0AA41W3R7_9GAMM|nr:NPP1 family protein [Echinimonas agarilytica]MCM2678134.1 NPP1 family protein [Echinimonas agarilytica]
MFFQMSRKLASCAATAAMYALLAMSPASAGVYEDFRPIYKLRSDLQCWPTAPNQGSNSGQCLSRSNFQSQQPPVYVEEYQEVVNGKSHQLITYWAYYGNQNGCASVDNGHDDDWEAMTLHLVDQALFHITYWQHNGRYTRKASDVELDGTHPVVYVGKYSHGNYHDQRSRSSADGWTFLTGGYCYYWKDPRGPGETWANGVAPLNDIGQGSIFPGSTNPLNRDLRPHERGVCRTDGGKVIGGIIDGTENTCQRNPSYLKDENLTLQDMLYLDIY